RRVQRPPLPADRCDLLRDAELPRRAESPRVSLGGPPAGRGVHIDHHLPVQQRLVERGSGRHRIRREKVVAEAEIQQRSLSMQCPIDQTELVMTERQGVEIDYCPKCRGVWLDRGELDKIIERSSAFDDSSDS